MKSALYLFIGCMTMATSAVASLSSTSILLFSGDTSVDTIVMPELGDGSWFAIETGSNQFTYRGMSAFNGVQIGNTQSVSGGHTGAIDGSEVVNIDNAWMFFGNTGMHSTSSPVSIISDDNAGTVILDFSGWNFSWNGVNPVMSTDAWNGNADGQAVLRCQYDCSMIDVVEEEYREWFTLDYSATIPVGDPSGLGGIRYQLHLESVNYVPVPAAVWLFGSGLFLLMGFVRRK